MPRMDYMTDFFNKDFRYFLVNLPPAQSPALDSFQDSLLAAKKPKLLYDRLNTQPCYDFYPDSVFV